MVVTPSSSGCRQTSKTWRRHYGRASRKSIPWCAGDTFPGSSTCLPPVSPTSEMVWCGARKGLVTTKAVPARGIEARSPFAFGRSTRLHALVHHPWNSANRCPAP
jgi:hypothetical protein